MPRHEQQRQLGHGVGSPAERMRAAKVEKAGLETRTLIMEALQAAPGTATPASVGTSSGSSSSVATGLESAWPTSAGAKASALGLGGSAAAAEAAGGPKAPLSAEPATPAVALGAGTVASGRGTAAESSGRAAALTAAMPAGVPLSGNWVEELKTPVRPAS